MDNIKQGPPNVSLAPAEYCAMVEAINSLTHACHLVALEKGWWNELQDTIPTKLLMIVTEIAEAVEELRMPNHDDPNKVGLLKELCDILIRTFDLLGRLGTQNERGVPGRVFADKFNFNLNRSPRHGGKII